MIHKLRKLCREARKSAKWRGHDMSRFYCKGGKTGHSTCRKCGRMVFVEIDPPPNGIDIMGEAVALNCK